MKAYYCLLTLLLGCSLPIFADDKPQPVTISDITITDKQTITENMDNTPFISKDEFITPKASEDAAPGDYMWFNVSTTRNHYNIRLGGYNTITYPGCNLLSDATIGEDAKYDVDRRIYLTNDMLDAIKKDHLRVYGYGTLTQVKIDKDVVKRDSLSNRISRGEKTLWTGYYWMTNFKTLELYPQAFNGINLNAFKSIRFYHEANRNDYIINIAKQFGPDVYIAEDNAITHENTYAELTLTPEIRNALANLEENTLKVQMSFTGDAFNFTDIVLVPPTPCDNCFLVTF